ncbi:hypothetical protein KY363_04700 [Candidatus Woesearchaeota archaeon]|nr:hypothetical protein [Candidatus Woesearchaeota archaeon]
MTRYVFILFAVLLAPLVSAELDSYFSVYQNDGPYEVLPGTELNVSFILQNKDAIYPENVSVFIDPCPFGWTCESKVLSYEHEGRHPVNLSVTIPESAAPNKYTIYLKLESNHWTTRGDDKVVITVLSESQAKTLSYDEYKSKYETVEVQPAKVVVLPPKNKTEVDVPAEEPVEEQVSEPVVSPQPVNESDNSTASIAEDFQRLESSRQFMEYASIVLIVVLVFIAAGAYVTFRKEE